MRMETTAICIRNTAACRRGCWCAEMSVRSFHFIDAASNGATHDFSVDIAAIKRSEEALYRHDLEHRACLRPRSIAMYDVGKGRLGGVAHER